MSIFAARSESHNWILPVSFAGLILGFMCSLAWVTQETRKTRKLFVNPVQNSRISESVVDIEKFEELQSTVLTLRKKTDELEKALASSSGQAKTLYESLAEIKTFAGLTEIEGSGIIVTLKDSPRAAGSGLAGADSGDIIHDTDVLRVVNELQASGAEAISVNDHRITSRASLRCVGPTILVNDIKIASPIEIRAIGDPKTLLGAMNLPGGILADIRQTDLSMVSIEEVKKMTLKAYTGLTGTRFGKVPATKP
jgi:uncharacterized protein YlxW (UPF0749 family)